MNPLKALNDYGQSVWLDFLARDFLNEGGLKRLIEQDGLRGVTSNPSIFEKAIGESGYYDAQLKQIFASGDMPVGAVYEALAVADIQRAADTLRPVYDATEGRDGFVSLEVSPYLALDTEKTIGEARRLWQTVGRDNLMVKVPATAQGLPAIRQLIGEGINVNITLLFSQDVYEEVVKAYIDGLETRAGKGGDVSRIASVASFFVSRIDSDIDKQIDEKLEEADDPDKRKALKSLKGKAAIANARLAYRRYKRLFSGERWQRLADKGGRTQRLLWASTGTKNPDYPDVLYVDELIGPDTVNTMPPKTLDAYRDHGSPRASLEANVDEAEETLDALDRAGISLDKVTTDLVSKGVQLFADSFGGLLGAIEAKRKQVRQAAG
ncbi:MAG: transaldolase [Rhizobiales bacterium]|nr:transaldolase [Hyphomicrobiales bacterium]